MRRNLWVNIHKRARIAPFVQNEAGTMTYFAAAILLLIVAIGGISVDVMNNEIRRAEVQSAMDEAALVALSSNQTSAADEVFEQQFTARGIEDFLPEVQSSSDNDRARINTRTQEVSETQFVNMLGVDGLPIRARVAAEQNAQNIEISIVLNASASMADLDATGRVKLDQVKGAVSGFVNTVMGSGSGARTTVSLVPYSGAVSLGPSIAPYYTIQNRHSHSHCPVINNSSFQSMGIRTSAWMEQMSHFQETPLTTSGDLTDPYCRTDPGFDVLLHESNPTAVINQLNLLQASGNSAIDVGVKWGLAFLHPDATGVVNGLVFNNQIGAVAQNRPAQLGDADTEKFLIIVADQRTMPREDLTAANKVGMSLVYVDDQGTPDEADDVFSVLVQGQGSLSSDVYFSPHLLSGTSTGTPWYSNEPAGEGAARQLSNVELFARFDLNAIYESFYRYPIEDGVLTDYSIDWHSWSLDHLLEPKVVTTSVARGEINLDLACRLAREADVIVYTLSFETDPGDATALRACASSPSHHFDVSGDEIADAFGLIGNLVVGPRLTQ